MSNALGNKKIMASNIKRLLNQKGLNGRQLALTLGFKYTTVNDWLNAKSYPRIDKIEIMANFFGVEKSDLVEDRTTAQTINKKRLNTNYDKLNSNNQNKLVNYSIDLLRDQISVIDETLFKYIFFDNALSAGTGQYLSDGQKETIELPIDIDCDFVAPIAGDSMLPEYQSGDFVFIKLTYNLQDNDIGVFVVDGDAYIKQLQIIDNRYYLHSLNPNYSDIEITNTTDFRIIGKVVASYPN